ncbi:MAG: Rid family detoxifying hydrolase, partial [Clostridia bacterium]|nr:Rid family detoxifying hydrolase [Clostridia bacterium]
GRVFTSGHIPLNPATGQIEANDVAGQTEQVCKNVAALLEAAGSSIDKVIKTVCFLADIKHFAAFNAVYANYFTSSPARSCVAVKDIPKGCLVEIEAIAEL